MKKMLITLVICGGVFLSTSFFKTPLPPRKVKITYMDSFAKERQKYIEYVLASVKDRQDMRADSVFENIQTFSEKQGIKVTHLLAIMDYWGEVLGVNCTYCHNTNNWASDDISQKQIARDMYAMRSKINDEILPKIKNLASQPVLINCGTCHKGSPKPSRD